MKVINELNKQKTFPVAVIVSRFNSEVTSALLEGALKRLKELEFSDDLITLVHIPGAVEIPLIAQVLAERNEYQAIICLGAVIRGETDHYDYVCDQVNQGCQRIALDYQIPVLFGVLTTQTEELALARAHNDNSNKGYQTVDAACEMVAVLHQLLPS